MTFEGSFQDLRRRLEQLRQALSALHVSTVVDRPAGDDVALVDSLGDAVDDILGLVDEALAAAQQARQAASHPRDLRRVTEALSRAHEASNRALRQLVTDLFSFERITEVLTVGRERRGEWHGWADSVKAAIDRCREPSDRVNLAIVACWQETTDKHEQWGVSVSTVSIGQQIGRLEGEPRGPGDG